MIGFSKEIGGMSVSKMNGKDFLHTQIILIWFKLFE